MSNYFEMYFNNMRSEGKSEKSINTYKSDVKSFENFLSSKGLSMDSIKEFDFALMNEFKISLSGQGLAANTINRRIRFIRSFMGYMVDMGIIKENPVDKVKDVKVPKRDLVIPSEVEINEAIGDIKTNSNRCTDYLLNRNKTITMMLSKLGLRNSELRELKMDDVNIRTGLIKVIGKGNKQRTVFLSESLKKQYKEYLVIRQNHLDKYSSNSDLVFISYRCKQISSKDMNQIVKGMHINNCNHTHVLRHYAATNMVRKNININIIQKILGHSNVQTTSIYLHVDKNDIQKAMQD